MATYRVKVQVELFFDVKANNESHALSRGIEIADRSLDNGWNIPNIDTEDELVDAVLYPVDEPIIEVVQVLKR